jgi:hypothetical protein
MQGKPFESTRKNLSNFKRRGETRKWVRINMLFPRATLGESGEKEMNG